MGRLSLVRTRRHRSPLTAPYLRRRALRRPDRDDHVPNHLLIYVAMMPPFQLPPTCRSLNFTLARRDELDARCSPRATPSSPLNVPFVRLFWKPKTLCVPDYDVDHRPNAACTTRHHTARQRKAACVLRVSSRFPSPHSSHFPRRRHPPRRRTRRPIAQRRSIKVQATEKDVFERKPRALHPWPADLNLWCRHPLSFATLRSFSCLAPQIFHLNGPTDGALHNRATPLCSLEAESPVLPQLFVLETLSTDAKVCNPHPQRTRT